jgi:hypothetical protein
MLRFLDEHFDDIGVRGAVDQRPEFQAAVKSDSNKIDCDTSWAFDGRDAGFRSMRKHYRACCRGRPHHDERPATRCTARGHPVRMSR